MMCHDPTYGCEPVESCNRRCGAAYSVALHDVQVVYAHLTENLAFTRLQSYNGVFQTHTTKIVPVPQTPTPRSTSTRCPPHTRDNQATESDPPLPEQIPCRRPIVRP